MGLDYRWANLKWEGIKPIRGRPVDTRPLGRRHRDWELIEKVTYPDGAAYALRLYQTRCVEYMPNGDVVLRTGGWHTPSTGRFIHQYSPFWVWKQNNVLWVRCYTDGPAYPLPLKDAMVFRRTEGGHYAPVDKVTITKRVVDRAKAKAAREHVQPFLQWAKTFLALSDGWVMHETRKQALGWETIKDSGIVYFPEVLRSKANIYNLMETLRDENQSHEATYLKLLCTMCEVVPPKDKRLSEEIRFDPKSMYRYRLPQRFYDYQMEIKPVKGFVYRLIAAHASIHKTVEVEPTAKVQSKVVQNA